MAIVNKIIHRFIRHRDDYMDPAKELYNQIIPYNVQAYSYELRPNGDPNIPDDYIVRYVLGTGRSTYQQIADGLGKDADGNAIPELSKEFVLNSNAQLIKIITDLIESQVILSSYITSDAEGNPFPTKASLINTEAWYDNGQSILPKKNDYAIVIADETHPTGTGDPQTTKYVCVGVTSNNKPVWNYQYIINNGNFIPEQQAAINSGITAEKVVLYDSYATKLDELTNHVTDYNNPHKVTAEQIGLGSVNNTSDADKPISTATQEALDTIGNDLHDHIEDDSIHVTAEDKEKWSNKQDVIKIGNHISINNNTISVLDDLSTYDNSVSRFIQKSSDDLDNYYTKEVIDQKFDDVPISKQTQEALDNLNDKIDGHIENEDIHVTAEQKEAWTNKQNALKLGAHVKISNDTISVEDDLSSYNNNISQFINKSTNELENYYTKEELGGIYKYQGEVATYDDLPSGNEYADPSVYTELTYLTADQLEYIDTHYHPNRNTEIRLKFSINGAGNNYLYGTDIEQGHEINKVAFGINYGATIAAAFFGNENVTFEIDNQVHILIQNKNGVYLDNKLIHGYENISDFITESTLWLFRAQTSDTHPQNISIYDVEIYEVNEVIAHYVPVKRKADDALGMYEVISEEFKQNEYNPSEFDFTPGEVAGYGNQEGWVYKVLENNCNYMWYHHEWILLDQDILIDEVTIQRNEEGAISTVGIKTKSDTIMYDWIGTKAEWEAGREAGTIPDEWICWITDDEEEPAGVANLAQVASTGIFEDLKNIPELPSDKTTKNYMLIWNHLTQQFAWVETDITPPEGEYNTVTHILTIPDCEWENEILTTSSIIPIDGQDEYDSVTHMLAISNLMYSDNTLTTNQIQPMENI